MRKGNERKLSILYYSFFNPQKNWGMVGLQLSQIFSEK